MSKTKILHKKEKGVNRHYKNYQDKQYLGAHNLEEGEELLLTIVKFEGEEMVQVTDGTKSAKMVLYFKEDKPKMILNETNARTISNIYCSTHPEDWYGKKIQIFATPVKAFGKTQDTLRIRDFIPERNIDLVEYAEKLNACQNKIELKKTWEDFSKSVQNSPELIALKDSLKEKLQ